jgi:hypothetical protein
MPVPMVGNRMLSATIELLIGALAASAKVVTPSSIGFVVGEFLQSQCQNMGQLSVDYLTQSISSKLSLISAMLVTIPLPGADFILTSTFPYIM